MSFPRKKIGVEDELEGKLSIKERKQFSNKFSVWRLRWLIIIKNNNSLYDRWKLMS